MLFLVRLGLVDFFSLLIRSLGKDFFLPKSLTDRLAQADKVKTEKENSDPYADLDKFKEFNLDLIREQDKISRNR